MPPTIRWRDDPTGDHVDFGTLPAVAAQQDATDKLFYAATHQDEMTLAFGKGLANGVYEALLPIGTYIGEEAARYSLGQYDQTTLGKVSHFVVSEELNGFPQTRALGDAFSGTIDGIVSDPANALSEGYDFAKGVVSSAGSALLNWLDKSSASEIAEGAGNEVGKFAALDGVGKVAEFGIAAGGLIAPGSGTFAAPADASRIALSPEVADSAEGVFSKDAPYVIRYDPEIPGRPDPRFSIDSLTFNNPVGYNAQGFPRDAGQFWKSWAERNPDSLSPSNRFLIENYGSLKVSPRVDQTWINTFPEHGSYNGDVLIHHHVDFGQYTIPVPGRTHVGSGGPWHL